MAHGPCPHVTFLIDECLTPLLEQVALDFGYHAYFIHHRGWSGLKDSQLYQKLIEHDLTLVTNNRSDWLAVLGKTALHPGLVVIQENAPRDKELAWFARCLVTMTAQHSMVNTVVEVAADGAVSVYALPAP